MIDTVQKTNIEGLLIIDRKIFPDNRGFFREVARLDELEKVRKEEFKPVQINHSRSKPGVVRALHAEGWNKLVYPAAGDMFAAIVDIRPDSPTFGKVETFEITSGSRRAIFVPKGLANSICVSGSQDLDYIYLVDAYYDGTDTKAVCWDDPDLNISWPVENPIISERDQNNPTLRQLFPEKFDD